MSGTKPLLDRIVIELKNTDNSVLPVYVDIFDNSLSRKWLATLNHLLSNNYHLEKNYCFFGFPDAQRNGPFILEQINLSIQAINSAQIGYRIDDYYSMRNCITDEDDGVRNAGRNIVHSRFNQLHRYFEDLQGVSGQMSPYFKIADANTRWHIRQLNLLCHEFESWALSYRKQIEAPDWVCPSQLMCWLNAPRFELDDEDYELFGIDTLNRSLGGVYVGVNKAVGKHHWEVFNDEGRDSRINELTTSTLRSQTEATGDFDIEWGRNPGEFEWRKQQLNDFRDWLTINGFDPTNQALTIGHPKIGQVDLINSFKTENPSKIWAVLNSYLDVYSIKTNQAYAEYKYHWSDSDFISRQISLIKGN